MNLGKKMASGTGKGIPRGQPRPPTPGAPQGTCNGCGVTGDLYRPGTTTRRDHKKPYKPGTPQKHCGYFEPNGLVG